MPAAAAFVEVELAVIAVVQDERDLLFFLQLVCVLAEVQWIAWSGRFVGTITTVSRTAHRPAAAACCY